MADIIYCYPGTDVLVNKLGIQDYEKLQVIERKLTMLRILDLIDKPIKGNFDFKHLCSIHYYIFQDVYDWAGKVRTVDIAKGNRFCNVMFIETQAKEIFESLRKELFLEGLNQQELARRLTYYFSEINALHPFREGNGRSQREFIRSLALKNGYVLNFSNISAEEMLKASQESFLCKYQAMEEIFEQCIRKQ